MNASYEWLRSLVPLQLDATAMRDLITARCATVDDLIPLRADLADVVVARVVEAAPHPNSDHLWVTKVDAGRGELLDVVCGAPNVRAGATYPFAPAGSTLPGGLKLEKRKIRGATSNGMLCSARELGLGAEHDGILELTTDAAPGTPFLRAMPVGDVRLVVDVSPNRPDLLSHFGLGRELAAATGALLTLPPIGGDGAPTADASPIGEKALRWRAPQQPGETSGSAGGVRVSIADLEGCTRYMGVVLRGVTVGPSPEWLVQRLGAVGSRSINNIVDVTNYLLHELGQPMHAFDAALLSGAAVEVRRARAGEALTTLDGVARKLDATMTVIADSTRAQALAGVMGGAASEVSAATTDIFLEVATFDPPAVRRTRRALGMSTDASYRFERGTDPHAPPVALDRAVAMLLALAGGRVDGAPVDLYPLPVVEPRVPLRVARVALLLGETIPRQTIEALLTSVGFSVTGNDHVLEVLVPSWRRDVTREVDLIEEVARLRGFDSFADELRPYRLGTVPDSELWVASNRVRDRLVAMGLFEARPMPFVAGDSRPHVRVVNPLADDEAFLRRDVLSSLSRRAEYNLHRMQRDVRLFEIGDVFFPGPDGQVAEEAVHVGALLMGRRHPAHWADGENADLDEWDAKGVGESLARASQPAATVEVRPAPSEDGRLWEIVIDGAPSGEVRRMRLDAPAWAAPAFGVELTLGTVEAQRVRDGAAHDAVLAVATPRSPAVRYAALPVMPAAQFDLALLVPDDVTAARVEAVMRATAGDLLESLVLFDEYRGDGVPAAMRSLAWRLTFRHRDRTLSAKEIDGRRERLLRTLDGELGVRPRTS